MQMISPGKTGRNRWGKRRQLFVFAFHLSCKHEFAQESTFLLLKIKKGNGEKPTAPQAHSICIDAVALVGEKETILKEPQHLGL